MGTGKTAATSTEVPGTNIPLPAPVPQIQVPTVPAPGQRGPKGLVGRQAYSRVNTGAPQAADAGAYAQKSIPPAGTKKTSEVSIMSTAARPTIQDMLKMAMAGTSSAAGSAVSRIKVAEEAKRQLENLDEEGSSKSKEKKTEDEEKAKEKVSGAYVLKLASAVEYCAEVLEKEGADLAGPYTLTETPMAPGMGPNALGVSESLMSAPVNLKDTGQAVASNQPPKNPPTQKAEPQERGGTQLQNDMDSAPGDGEPPISGSTTNYAKVARVMKVAFAVTDEGHKYDAARARIEEEAGLKNLALGQQMGGIEHRTPEGDMEYGNIFKVLRGFGKSSDLGEARHKNYVAGKHEAGRNAWNPFGGIATPHEAERGGTSGILSQLGTVTPETIAAYQAGRASKGKTKKASFIRYVKKMAEDATSPSSISAGPVQQNDQGPPGVLNSSEAGPPAQDKGKVPVGHDATRAFTRADAKATPKQEMKAVLDEPMMSSQTDKVLDVNLSHDGDSKISSARDVTKVAAARALLAKLHREAQN